MLHHKRTLENAYIELRKLLDNNESEEKKFQAFFENNPIVFEVLGYQKHFPLTKQSGKSLPRDIHSNLQPEPDFLAQKENGYWDIVEIKTPLEENLLIDKNSYRVRFRSVIESYISQVNTYSTYFNNPSNRKLIKEEFGYNFQSDVPAVLIIGLRDKTDLIALHEQLAKYAKKPEIIFYDELLEKLRNFHVRVYGKFQNNSVSVTLGIRLKKPKQNNYSILELKAKKNPSSAHLIYSIKDGITFKVTDRNGATHTLNYSSLNYLNRWIMITCSLASSKDSSLISLYVNNVEKAQIINSHINAPILRGNLTLGCNERLSSFGLYDLSYQSVLFNDFDFLKLHKYHLFLEDRMEILSPDIYWEFYGHTYLFGDLSKSYDLKQKDHRYRPRHIDLRKQKD